VAVSGVIGFVGLIVPHMMRLVVGPDHRILLPTSAIAGAAFLVATDTVARTWAGEIPVGIVTAALGAPFFLFLLRRREVHAL
jgi:iron complex transport system permease protein